MNTMIKKKKQASQSVRHSLFLFSVVMANQSFLANAFDNNLLQQDGSIVALNVEELRITKANDVFPEVVNRHQNIIDSFKGGLSRADHLSNQEGIFRQLDALSIFHGNKLWVEATQVLRNKKDGDDRALYWARLQLSKTLKQYKKFVQLSSEQQESLLWRLELASRGQNDAVFDNNTRVKILLTGFDPFFLDKHIEQSNPSGVAAMMLDGQIIEYQGIQAEIESFVVPVRFADFDQGMIEQLLTPYIKASTEDSGVDFVFTISMGRKDFDIERFPSLRRSAKAPDNLNVYTGASSSLPLVPSLNGLPLNGSEYQGAEFVEFSLPVEVMQKAETHFNVIDNRKISTLTSKFEPTTLSELAGKVSVSGSGGGYLSNEISYRSILIRNSYNPTLPVGHIHTPRIAAFEPKTSIIITDDIKKMLEQVSFNLGKAESN